MVKSEFQPGVTEELTVTTTPDMGITHLGPDAPSMYSTPSMVQLIEGTCVKLMTRYVDAGEQSVGFHVDVRHLAPTPIGKKVTAKVTLREVNGRRCLFDVEVHSEDGVKIGEGIHERAVIDIARFAERAQSGA
jgi:predicted thioesterase